jgi:rubrerythrin
LLLVSSDSGGGDVAESETDPRERPAAEGEAPTLRCDTCGRPTATVARVVIDEGYNRSNARPLWNCPECYAKKERHRVSGK